jgi:putative membrane protein
VSNDSDPRIFFAAERTLLAWVRTGLAVIGIGFLVARFGLFLRMLRSPSTELEPALASSVIGIGFVTLGAAIIAVSAWQHARFCGKLPASQRPAHYGTAFGIGAAALIAALGLALAGYLLPSATNPADYHQTPHAPGQVQPVPASVRPVSQWQALALGTSDERPGDQCHPLLAAERGIKRSPLLPSHFPPPAVETLALNRARCAGLFSPKPIRPTPAHPPPRTPRPKSPPATSRASF